DLYALDIPMYFFYRGGQYLNATQGTFRQFMAGEHPQYKGEKPSLIDWENHLSTLFPEVRLKRFLEMRGADGGRWRKLCAMPALWVGVLYDGTALDAAWDLVKDWTDEERQQLRDDVPKLALDAPFRDGTVNDIAKQMLEISRLGLKNRNRQNPLCDDETIYLESIQRIVNEGKPPAARMIEQFENEWNGDIDQIFKHYAY
ncbi:MAG TPA: glutamate--cysteine ligase, partial [Calditrichaeota bacterium]|nr:glutamate--cysteine ligase [Calditrichota bacterium]